MRAMLLGLVASLALACGGDLDGNGGGDGGGGGGTLYEQLDPALQDLFDEINGERTSRGLSPVTLRADLVCAADRHSDDIGPRSDCTHDGSDGSGPGDRVRACGGGGWTGEIVACGQGTARGAVDVWLNSPGHRSIMLGSSKAEIGVGVTNNFWTAIFDD